MFLFLFNWGLFSFSSMLLFCFGVFFVCFFSQPPPSSISCTLLTPPCGKYLLTCNQNGVSCLRICWADKYVLCMNVYLLVCAPRSGSRIDVPKRDAWNSWARWAPGGTRFSGAREGWGRWWTGWSPGSCSPTGPSPTMEVWEIYMYIRICLHFNNNWKIWRFFFFLEKPQYFS